MNQLSDEDFRLFSQLVHESVGIHFGPAKRGLVQVRLNKRIQKLGLGGFREYYHYATHENTQELTNLFNALSTNLTGFFREPHHFDFLGREILPRLVERPGERKLRVWSAACSTGEEPYSVAITIMEHLKDWPFWNIKILATDISTSVLEAARNGIFDNSRVEDLSKERLRSFFLKGSGDAAGSVRIKPELQDFIVFRRLNLAVKKLPFTQKFDVVFCRNVLIYFDAPTRTALLDQIHACLAPGGYLFLGHAEGLQGMGQRFVSAGPTTYRRL